MADKDRIKRLFIQHDVDALSDIKVSAICEDFGFEAYGLMWFLYERMWTEEELALPYKPLTFSAVKRQTGTTIDVKKMVDVAVEYELFELDGELFYSPALVRRYKKLETAAEEKSEKARAAINARWKKERAKPKKNNTQKYERNTDEYERNTDVIRNDTDFSKTEKVEKTGIRTKKTPKKEDENDAKNDTEKDAKAYSDSGQYGRNTDEYESILKEKKRKELYLSASTRTHATTTIENAEPEAGQNILPASSAETPWSRVIQSYMEQISYVPVRKEHDSLRGWLDDGYEAGLILGAIDEAVIQNKKSLSYISRIIEACGKEGVKTEAQWLARKKSFEARVKSRDKSTGNRWPAERSCLGNYSDTGSGEPYEINTVIKMPRIIGEPSTEIMPNISGEPVAAEWRETQ